MNNVIDEMSDETKDTRITLLSTALMEERKKSRGLEEKVEKLEWNVAELKRQLNQISGVTEE